MNEYRVIRVKGKYYPQWRKTPKRLWRKWHYFAFPDGGVYGYLKLEWALDKINDEKKAMGDIDLPDGVVYVE